MVRIVTFFTLSAVLLPCWGCGVFGSDPETPETISPGQFVEAYIKLRSEGLRSPMAEITPVGRDRVLEELGLSQEDLLTFVEVWGENGEVMQRVWEEIDSLLREERMRGRRTEDEGEEESVGFREVGLP